MKKNGQRTAGMKRREALTRMMAGVGSSVVIPPLCRAASTPPALAPNMSMPGNSESPSLGSALPPDPSLSSGNWKPKFFDEHQNETVVAVSDLIIPDTDTPGAKAAQANRFIDLLLSAENADTQKQYIQALNWFDGYCLSRYSRPFVELNRDEQASVLTLLTYPSDDPQIAYGAELFGVIKDSIVQAYYTSEVGLLRELKYQTNPFQQDYPGCKNPPERG
jgi:hypothetical protein